MAKAAKWLLHIRPEPDHTGTDPDGIRRLRGFLKTMLRAWNLRCVNITLPTGEECKSLLQTSEPEGGAK